MPLPSPRLTIRFLLRSPGFALVAISTIAVGIAANTAIFSLVNTILMKPLPYAEAERLVWLSSTASARGGDDAISVSPPDYEDWRGQAKSFSDMAAYQDSRFYLAGEGAPERVSGATVSPQLFAVLGVEALTGRVFRPEEGIPGQAGVTLIGYGLWQRHFSGDPGAIGKTLIVNGDPHQIVGIMPRRFRFPEYAEMWIPLAVDAAAAQRDRGALSVVARLVPGVELPQARTEMQEIARRLAEAYPDADAGKGVMALPLRRYYVGDTGLASLVFLAATGFLLLIVCANLASLLLARAMSRRKEMALRSAIGARQRDLVLQLLAESVVLSLLGGVPGLALGVWGLHRLIAAIPIDLPFWADFQLDFRVMAFVLALAAVTGIVVGVLPALRSSRVNLNELIKAGGDLGHPGSRLRLQRLLVVAEVAAALALLVSAGLMVKGFLALQRVDPGVRTAGILTARVSPLQSPVHDEYGEAHEQRQLQRRIVAAVVRLPAVQSATAAAVLPVQGGPTSNFTLEGAEVSGEEGPTARLETVGDRYFELLEIPLLAGRLLDERDDERALLRAVVNRAFADRHGVAREMVGRRLKLAASDEEAPWIEIVGVVGDVRQTGLDSGGRPSIYVPFAQHPQRLFVLLMRTDAEPMSLADSVRAAVRDVDPDLPVDAFRTLQRVIGETIWQPSIYSWLLTVFAGIALLLAALGVAGVVSFEVSQRTREIAIRTALGAHRGDVLRLIAGEAIVNVGIGIGLGLIAAFALSNLMASVLMGFGALEPVLPLVLIGGFLAVAFLSAFLPARRAIRLEPMNVLRVE